MSKLAAAKTPIRPSSLPGLSGKASLCWRQCTAHTPASTIGKTACNGFTFPAAAACCSALNVSQAKSTPICRSEPPAQQTSSKSFILFPLSLHPCSSAWSPFHPASPSADSTNPFVDFPSLGLLASWSPCGLLWWSPFLFPLSCLSALLICRILSRHRFLLLASSTPRWSGFSRPACCASLLRGARRLEPFCVDSRGCSSKYCAERHPLVHCRVNCQEPRC